MGNGEIDQSPEMLEAVIVHPQESKTDEQGR